MPAGYPFSAVVGMDDLKLALALNAVAPTIGGVLVRGEKGTAKSTVVRALAALLPEQQAVDGCRFGCDPAAPDPECPDGPHPAGAPAYTRRGRLVELPVGAAEDRVVGSLDLERALTEGVRSFEPGLLAAAHRGVLYVDEVNLLHDHLVDVLLDAAAMGRCYVEREGVSVSHAARFLLVGTMNPEEGELRPQLLDRFGLTVHVAASREPAVRAEVVRRGLTYEADPDAFAAVWAPADAEFAACIESARELLPHVSLPDAELERIAHVCAEFEVDGMRADLVTARAARAHAAWHGRLQVTAEDVRAAARLALPHRRRRDPFDAPGLDEAQLDKALDEAGPPPPDEDPDGGPDDRGGAPDPAEVPADAARSEESSAIAPAPSDVSGGSGGEDRMAAPGEPYKARLLTVPGLGTGTPGRRSRAVTPTGHTSGARRPLGRLGALHAAATLRTAAPHQRARGRVPGEGLRLRPDDLREAVREGREGNLVLFCVDASGSMGARSRMGSVKAAVLALLLDAYQRRDKVGLVTFRGTGATLDLPPTSSVEAGAARMRALPTGGRTPLAAGLLTARHALGVERLRDPARRPLLVLVTDGRATAGSDALAQAHRAAAALAGDGIAAVVVDCEDGPVRLGLAAGLAEVLGAPLFRLGELEAAGGLANVVRSARRVA
ncbi:MAG TPA: putative cobaltochelatase [Sporichthya sp.]|nr:putative cobaltochelatase [Sporichthya sp.]